MASTVPSKGLEWTNLIVGIGLFGAPVVFAEPRVAVWNAAIVGALIATWSAITLYRYKVWAEWSNLALGAWAMLAPFLFKFGSAQPATSIHVIAGLWVCSIACMQLVASRDTKAAGGKSANK